MIEDRRQKNGGTKKLKNSVIFCFFVFPFFCFSVFADKIYLKDGKSYEGKLIGKSDRRYLFSMTVGGESFRMSFFPEDVEKIELGKDTVEEQIPYLKEVESFNVEAKEDKSKTYQLSLYKESQSGVAEPHRFSEKELKKSLNKQESEYYTKFNAILKKYIDKLQFVQNLYLNLTVATREDFAQAIQYMDEVYFELNNIYVPEAFKKSHVSYLDSLKAAYLAFNALLRGMLDEASKQIKISEESKQHSMEQFRQVIVSRKLTTETLAEKSATASMADKPAAEVLKDKPAVQQ
jgi:hypothetical protein